jgi:DNA mismatch repair protein MutS
MELSPGMKQYFDIKDKHPDCLVLFRMGDFYETFYEDAKTAARVLDITLTARGKGEKRAPLAGIPYHALDTYLGKLVKTGHKVCIVEQLEDPKLAKGLVKRGVARIVTPGTVIEDSILSQNNNNFLLALNKENDVFGLSLADISTGEFLTTEVKDENKLLAEIDKFNPAEVIVPTSYFENELIKKIKDKDIFVNSFDDRFFWGEKAEKTIKEHFNVLNLEGFGLKAVSVTTSGALLSYINTTQFSALNHINKINTYSVEKYMVMDSATQRNLELLRNIRDGSSRGTLFDVINKTTTSMGARKLKKWLLRPLLEIKDINKRLDGITELIDDAILKEDIKEVLAKFSDIERIIGKVSYGSSNARDLISLKFSLQAVPKLKELLINSKTEFLKEINQIDELKESAELIEKAIKDEPAAVLKEGNIIKKGYSQELDELRDIAFNGKKWMSKFEEDEKEKTGIKSLKIKYNRVFGYFIEVTKSNVHLVPNSYIRKQTQVNHERYITEDLKKKEDMILGAQDKINSLEYSLFVKVCEEIVKKTLEIQNIADKVSSLDCLVSLAVVAAENNYCRPEVSELDAIKIENGRHPVIEKITNNFVDNDVNFDENERMKIITGPNMSGKSTLLRQNALIILMAQIGSYVPAKVAKIGIVDRIFSRVGAYDDLSMGQSTFMVEMNETANILNNSTPRSFIILDEIGRGTSTYDGFSLAWAISEYLYTRIRAKTMFATHYHQLNKMTEQFSGIKNYHVLVEEKNDKITFLRKMVSGGTDKSYGVHVAKLAGLPNEVIKRSKVLMKTLEEEDKIMRKLEEKVVTSKKVEIEDEFTKKEIQITETITKKPKQFTLEEWDK